MTFACQITVARILMVPVFAVFAMAYGISTDDGDPRSWLRWTALATFIVAAASDGIDGWVARRFNQVSKLGAFLDPIADKLLLATGVLVLALVDWGREGWHLPLWFAAIVLSRDALILIGVRILWNHRCEVRFSPHWIGKVTTVTQMVALGWVMLGWIDVPPFWPCAIAAAFTLASAVVYFLQARDILRCTAQA